MSPMVMAARTKGATGIHSLIALLLALEARYYVLTSGSNPVQADRRAEKERCPRGLQQLHAHG